MESSVKKISILFVAIVILLSCFSMISSGRGIKIWPGKINIEVNRWYDEGADVDRATISVTNVETFDILVRVTLENPAKEVVEEGYSYIPELSWLKVTPQEFYVPAESTKEVEITLEVPEDQQENHYNEKWETWVIVSTPPEPGGAFNIQTNLAAKLFVQTPEGKKAELQPIHIILLFLISIFILYLAIDSIRKKKSREAMFYFKEKKRGK